MFQDLANLLLSFYPVILVFVYFLLRRNCSCRVIMRCFQGFRFSNKSVTHGVCAFLVLCFAKISVLAFGILKSADISYINGISFSRVVAISSRQSEIFWKSVIWCICSSYRFYSYNSNGDFYLNNDLGVSWLSPHNDCMELPATLAWEKPNVCFLLIKYFWYTTWSQRWYHFRETTKIIWAFLLACIHFCIESFSFLSWEQHHHQTLITFWWKYPFS